jgi:CubicO group peptidase (beta-lactamase class C family)
MTKLAAKLIASFVLISGLICFPRNIRSLRPPAQPQNPDILVGVWGSEQTFGPAVRGELTLDATLPQWRARIAGFDVSVHRDNEAIAFSLENNAGEFRGHVSSGGKSLTGDWIQPAGVTFINRYATPVHFVQSTPGIWTGQVAPLDDHVSLYVSIQRAQDGSLTAFIRNPEFNIFRRRTFRVETDGTKVILRNTQNSGDNIRGTYDPKSDRLALPALDSRPAVQFTRRSGGNAVGFVPRDPGVPYVYKKPDSFDDGWTSASLADVGLDAGYLKALVSKIITANLQDNPLNIHSLLIARHGKLVFEEYFYGYASEQTHDTRSAGKTYGPVLAGIAHDRGFAISPETNVYALFPQYKPFAHWDDRKNRLTLQNLMTMTSGLACDDNDDSSPGKEDTMQQQHSQNDWFKYALDLPMARDPGGDKAIYCSAGMNLVGGVVRNSTNAWIPEFFEENLARPLQFRTYHINLTPTGEAYMGGGISIRPRDEIKLGQLYLSEGIWNGRRIVSSSWVQDSIAPHSNFPPQIDVDLDHQYGYGWHINPLKTPTHTYRSFSAGGNGGQMVIVIPELDIVVAFNGGSYGEFAKWYRWGLELVPQYIIPAVQK